MTKFINFWRNSPESQKLKYKNNEIKMKNVFSSGREAITYILKINKFKRNDKIAIPEWSSHCLLSAVGKLCQPVSINDVIKHNIKVKGLIFYDQWGWSNLEKYKKKLIKKFKKKILIHDRVDSVDLNFNKNQKDNQKIYSVFSLSKTIGLKGGGLLIYNNSLLKNENYKSHDSISLEIDKLINRNKRYVEYFLDFRKSNIKTISKNDKNWIQNNNISKAFESEFLKRKNNLEIFFNSTNGKKYPKWMKQNLKNNIGPNCIPIFKNKSINFLKNKKNYLFKKYNIETQIYHFDWAGNPLSPTYLRSLIVPVHGEVKNFQKIVRDLKL